MPYSAEWPLLRETGLEIRSTAIRSVNADVLNDPCFLIVSFFDQEAVVLNARRWFVLCSNQCWCETQQNQQLFQVHDSQDTALRAIFDRESCGRCKRQGSDTFILK